MSYFILFVTLLTFTCSEAWLNDPEKIHISNLKSITLHQGQWTTGRRNPPVPQLKCVGGSASCSAFLPYVIQCQNVGSDGFDAQWKCETDMDDSYRFGKIQVTCEGYDYPNDPYILRGSCGLEYTIDYTEAGMHKNSFYLHSNQSSFTWKFFLFWLVAGYIIYKFAKRVMRFIRGKINEISRNDNSLSFRNCNNPFSTSFSSSKSIVQDQGLTPTAPPPYDEATFANSGTASSNRANTSGFLSGISLGGLLGYLFGSWTSPWRSNRYHYTGYSNRWNSGSMWGSSWARPSTTHSWASAPSYRTTTGYGGTSRR